MIQHVLSMGIFYLWNFKPILHFLAFFATTCLTSCQIIFIQWWHILPPCILRGHYDPMPDGREIIAAIVGKFRWNSLFYDMIKIAAICCGNFLCVICQLPHYRFVELWINENAGNKCIQTLCLTCQHWWGFFFPQFSFYFLDHGINLRGTKNDLFIYYV